jgi:hypothetical protein
MMLRPARRFLTGPRPPVDLAARLLAAVILPPLLFFAILKSALQSLFQVGAALIAVITRITHSKDFDHNIRRPRSSLTIITMTAMTSNILIRPPAKPPTSPTSQRITITTIMATNRSINEPPRDDNHGALPMLAANLDVF